MRLALASVLALAACAEPVDLSWSVSVVDPVGCTDIVAYEARIERDGCGGEVVYDELSFAGAGDALPPPPPLSPGRWGFRIRARDSGCVYVADRCVELDLPDDEAAVDIEVSCSSTAELACAAGVCSSGLCPGDPPPPPRLRWPPSGYATGTYRAVLPTVLRWFAQPGITEYQVSLSPPCDGPAAGCEPSSDPRSTTALELPLASLGLARRPGGTRRSWRVRSCADGLCGPWSRQRIIVLDRLHGDLNGDGYADMLVGVPDEADGRAIYLYGAPTLDTAFEPIEASLGSSALLGSAVAMVDLDADGFADALVGAPAAAGGSGGVVFARGTRGVVDVEPLAFPGTAGGEMFGAAVAMVGDVDADGYNDIAVGAPAFAPGGRVVLFLERGSVTQVLEHEPAASASFGAAITGGDLDGDGYADVVVGEPGRGGGVGRVLIFRGGPMGVGPTPTVIEPGAPQPGLDFGAALAMLHDFDGDSLADLVVGAPGWDPAGDGAQRDGRVFVYRGDETSVVGAPAEISTPTPAGGRFGASLSAGYVDGDTLSDLAVGAPGAPPGGVALIYLSTGATFPSLPDRTIADAPGGALAGSGVGIGDANGDGFGDLLVGAPGEGAARVYFGSRAGLSPLAVIRLGTGLDRFGAVVSFGR